MRGAVPQGVPSLKVLSREGNARNGHSDQEARPTGLHNMAKEIGHGRL